MKFDTDITIKVYVLIGFAFDCDQVKMEQQDGENNIGTETDTENSRINTNCTSEILYTIDDVPPWYTAALLGLQHFLAMFVSQIAQATLVCDIIGVGDDAGSRGQLISTVLTLAALSTSLQTTFGSRLPIVQGMCSSFLLPLMVISSLPKWPTQGAENCTRVAEANFTNTTLNIQNVTKYNSTTLEDLHDCHISDIWKMKMTEAQGGLIAAAFTNVIIGYSGVLGLILPYVRHLTVAVVITMIGFPMANLGARLAGQSWPIAISTATVAIIFGQYFTYIKVPIPVFLMKKKKWEIRRAPVFSTYPVLLAMLLAWMLCAILTAGGALQAGSPWKQAIRTDTKIQAVRDAAWIRFPLPFQWGKPSFSVSGFIGMFFGVLASTIESIGDYYACARMSGASKPPVHAINRGIGTEGLGNLLCGIWGTGVGVTSYTTNIGIIAVTKVGSRRVVQFAALWMLLSGLLSKLGALFATVPRPVIGGAYLYIVGFIISAGLSELQFVNLSRTRNMCILGISLGVGISVPAWIKADPSAVASGNASVDQTLIMILTSTMFVGGALAMFLDNTIPDPDRTSNRNISVKEERNVATYNFPCGMSWIQGNKYLKYLPCSPTFKGCYR